MIVILDELAQLELRLSTVDLRPGYSDPVNTGWQAGSQAGWQTDGQMISQSIGLTGRLPGKRVGERLGGQAERP